MFWLVFFLLESERREKEGEEERRRKKRREGGRRGESKLIIFTVLGFLFTVYDLHWAYRIVKSDDVSGSSLPLPVPPALSSLPSSSYVF